MYFEPITIRQRPLIDKYLSVWGLENSIYTASNLIMWGHEGKLKVAEEAPCMGHLYSLQSLQVQK